MKVTGSKIGLLNGIDVQQGKAEQISPSQFRRILQQSVPQGETTGPIQRTNSLPEIHSAHPIQVVHPEKPLVSRAAQILDLFNDYCQQLDNPDVTLKQIEPVLNDMVSQTEFLHRDCTNTVDCPPGFKRITEELFMQAKLEQFKFQRGDYITS